MGDEYDDFYDNGDEADDDIFRTSYDGFDDNDLDGMDDEDGAPESDEHGDSEADDEIEAIFQRLKSGEDDLESGEDDLESGEDDLESGEDEDDDFIFLD